MTRTRNWAGLTCLVALAAAACGTTVPQATTLGSSAGLGQTVQQGQTSGDAASGLEPAAPVADGGTAAAQGAVTATTSAGGVTTGVTGVGTSTVVAPTSGATTTGRGVTTGTTAKSTAAAKTTTTATKTAAKATGAAKKTAASPAASAASAAAPITIGYATETDITSFASTLGVSGVDAGDTEAQMQAVKNDINAHGGIDGHQLNIDEYAINTSERASNASSVAQAACAHWTQDNHDFAVVDAYVGVADLPGMTDCLKAANTPLISDFPTYDAAASVYASDPLFASPTSMPVDSYIPAEVDRLFADGYFTGWNTVTGTASKTAAVKIGVETFDNAGGRHYTDVLNAALARHGLKITDIEKHASNPEAAATGAASAVLQFQTDQITHVFFANVVFYSDAQSQGYHPRYNVDDLLGPELLAENVGANQLTGSMGAGYQPFNEVTAAANPTPASNACLAVEKAAGQVPGTELATQSMLGICSHFYLLQQIFAHATSLTTAAFTQGLNSLGGAFIPAATYSASFSATRHWGAASIRDYAYDPTCTCYNFTSTTLTPTP